MWGSNHGVFVSTSLHLHPGQHLFRIKELVWPVAQHGLNSFHFTGTVVWHLVFHWKWVNYWGLVFSLLSCISCLELSLISNSLMSPMMYSLRLSPWKAVHADHEWSKGCHLEISYPMWSLEPLLSACYDAIHLISAIFIEEVLALIQIFQPSQK